MNNKKGKNAHQVVEGANGIVEVQGNNTNLVQTDGQTNGRLEAGESQRCEKLDSSLYHPSIIRVLVEYTDTDHLMMAKSMARFLCHP